MARTVHHVPLKHRDTAWWSTDSNSATGSTGSSGSGEWTAHTLIDLRYSYAELRAAHRAGRRPIPRRVTRSFASYTFPRAAGTPIHGRPEHESRARTALHLFTTHARKELRTSLTTAEDLDHPPTRHRKVCMWW